MDRFVHGQCRYPLRVASGAFRNDDWTSRATDGLRDLSGGNDALPKAMAARLANRIRYNSTATRIQQSKEKVRVTVRENGSNHVIEAERGVVCTLPFSTLRDLDFLPMALSKVRSGNHSDF